MTSDGDFASCFMTGSELLEELQFPEDHEDYAVILGHAYGYIAAVVDAHTLFSAAEGFPPVFSFPDIEFCQVASLIAAELALEPDLLDGTAASLVVMALRKHFPFQ